MSLLIAQSKAALNQECVASSVTTGPCSSELAAVNPDQQGLVAQQPSGSSVGTDGKSVAAQFSGVTASVPPVAITMHTAVTNRSGVVPHAVLSWSST